jgi:fumarate hydratase class II
MMPDIQEETNGLGIVEILADTLWNTQAQRSLEPTVPHTVEK